MLHSMRSVLAHVAEKGQCCSWLATAVENKMFPLSGWKERGNNCAEMKFKHLNPGKVLFQADADPGAQTPFSFLPGIALTPDAAFLHIFSSALVRPAQHSALPCTYSGSTVTLVPTLNHEGLYLTDVC